MNSAGAGKRPAHLPAATESGAVNDSTIQAIDSLFSDGGETGALMRALDWSQTAVGPVSIWPQSLKTAVRIILTSRYAMFVWWGHELVNLYNDPYRAFLGNKHPAALGKSAREVWAEIWEQIGPRADAVLLRGESTYDEGLLLLMARHGYVEETYFTFSYSPLPNDEGSVGGIFCAVTEDTEQVIGERRLRLLREIAAAMAEGRTPTQVCESAATCLANAGRDLPFTSIYLLDEQGKTLTKAAATGFDGDHAAAPSSVRLDDDQESVWPFRSVMESGQPVLLEDLSERFDDVPKGEWNDPAHCAILLPIAQQGQLRPSGVFVAGLNPYRKFGDDYRGFVSLLASQIGGAIANAVAYETERLRAEALAELDRAKTQFFSNISHEFRTPLTLMLGPLEEVLPEARERLAPERHEQLVVAHSNALRLLKLVNSLLDFSRIEAGRVEAVYEPTQLSKLTEEISSVFRSAMEKAGLTFTVECNPISEPVYVDRDMWEKIVLNLLSNAFKFTFEGGVTVRLQQVGNTAQLSVSDTGTGIPQGELPRIFERFHRVESARSRTFEGTGIGLALVQELAKLHGGTVRATSSVGQGSTFTLAIPLGKAHLPAERIQAKPKLRSAALIGEGYVEEAQRWLPQASGASAEESVVSMLPSVAGSTLEADTQRELILLADDNADMREYVAHLLRDRYRVHTVADGAQAVEAARRLRPNLILADVMMPRLDGFGVLRAIRDDAGLSGTPVILLSARAGEESRVEGLHAGANDYLVKPFTARELLARIGSHLAIAKLRNEQGVAAQRLAAIVESADDVIISKDLNGIVTSWNRAAERIFGYRAEEMIGRSILTIIPPELHDDEPRILSTIARGERIDHFETVRVAKNGERIDVALTVSPVKNESGRIVGAAKIARDITERKRIERYLATQYAVTNILAASHSLSEAAEPILQTMCAGLKWEFGALWQLNEERQLLTCLHAFPESSFRQFARFCFEISFRPGVDLPGRVWETKRPAWIRELETDGNVPRAPIAVAEGLRSGFAFPIEIKGNVEAVIEFFSREIRERDEKLLEMISAVGSQLGQFMDRKRTEGALRNVEKVAVAGRMALSIAHEINNPLEAVTNALFLLNSSVQDDQGRQFLSIAESELERVTQITKQTLAFYIAKLAPESVDLQSILDGVVAAVSNKLSNKRITLIRRDEPCSVWGLKAELRQLFLNLIDNAVEAAPENGKIEVLAGLRGSKVAISITDNGKGISPENLPKVFEPFFSTKEHWGTGLGLWVAREIAERHDGSITVQSRNQNADHGTTFQVILGALRERDERTTTAA